MLTCLNMACTENHPKVQLALSKNQQSVIVSGLSATELNGMARDSMPMEAWQNLLAVTQTPPDNDTTTIEHVISGKYSIDHHLITFTPDTAFHKGQSYKARFYLLNEGDGPIDMIMKHKQLGQPNFLELRFKPGLN